MGQIVVSFGDGVTGGWRPTRERARSRKTCACRPGNVRRRLGEDPRPSKERGDVRRQVPAQATEDLGFELPREYLQDRLRVFHREAESHLFATPCLGIEVFGIANAHAHATIEYSPELGRQ
jgi:hypothetical protein